MKRILSWTVQVNIQHVQWILWVNEHLKIFSWWAHTSPIEVTVRIYNLFNEGFSNNYIFILVFKLHKPNGSWTGPYLPVLKREKFHLVFNDFQTNTHMKCALLIHYHTQNFTSKWFKSTQTQEILPRNSI